MMKTKFGFLFAILFIALYACQKDELFSTDDGELALKSAEIATDDITLHSILEEVNYEAELFAQSEMMLRQLAHINRGKSDLFRGKFNPRYATGQFPKVTIDTAATGYPIKITIDYGTKTVLHHGREISGVVNIDISAARNTTGATRTITYKNGCKVDSVAITGTVTEKFEGDNATTRKTVSTTGVNFVMDNGTKLEKTGTETRDWLAGLSTQQDHSDDKIQVTGNESISRSNGDSWTKNISNPLIRLGTCRHYVKGVVEYKVKGSVAVVLNYGDGTCDDKATVTANGKTVDIVLAMKKAGPIGGRFPWGKGKH